ncbi:tetratricopeptide repeat-containing sensor histidine kinase [Winogradskyella aquimaris]|uniref:Histidine kinase n=1 Tax=Winogradskyella aquimaris TaxID=864074 RepID=A0ABU5EUU5_9FLAO|nr:histidine kinase [Winogradskyella aquimaris]MDY2588497.1 histidine kinase [Winogradskyella aquimaris]
MNQTSSLEDKINSPLVDAKERFNLIMQLAKEFRPFPISPEIEENGMPERFLSYATDAIDWALKNGTESQLASARRFLIDYYCYARDIESFTTLANEMVKSDNFATLQDKHFVYLKLGEVYKDTGFIKRYIELAPIQFEVGRKLKLKDSHAHEEFNHIALAYYNLKDYRESIIYFKKSLKKLKDEERPFAAASISNNIGLSFSKCQNKDSAKVYFNNALKILENANATKEGFGTRSYKDHFKNVIKTNISLLDIHTKQYDQIIRDVQAELRTAIEQRERTTEIQAYNKLGRLFYLKKEYSNALKNLNLGESKFLMGSDNQLRLENWKWKSKCLLALGYIDEGESLSEQREKLEDSIASTKIKQTARIASVLYEVDKKNSQLEAQNMSIQLLNSKNRNKNLILVFGSIGLIGLFSFVVLIRSRNSAIQKQQMNEDYSRKLIQAQEEEKTRLARDLHDSVGQQLTLIKRKASNNNFDDLTILAQEVLEEVRTISKGLYPANLKQLGLSESIEQLLYDLDEENDAFFSVEVDNINGYLNEEESLNFYRFIQEAINNVVKHSNAKTVILNISVNNDKIKVLIKDNGKGFGNVNYKLKNSLGLKTMAERIAILKGTFQINSRPGAGTLIKAKIPIL